MSMCCLNLFMALWGYRPCSDTLHNPKYNWLVVSTHLKNISQLGSLFPIYGRIKFMFQTTNQIRLYLVKYIYIYHIYYPVTYPLLYPHKTPARNGWSSPASGPPRLEKKQVLTGQCPFEHAQSTSKAAPNSWIDLI